MLIGFIAGIYALPILTAPPGPDSVELNAAMENAKYQGTFTKELAGSDFLHWGEGTLSVSSTTIALEGSISPGPDYQLYLSPIFVETEESFEKAKAQMVNVGPVKTFENFIIDVPNSIDVNQYSTVVIWCESFGEFITAAEYR